MMRKRKTTNIDEKDMVILDILSKDSRASLSKISQELGISKAAVKKRINKLVDTGIIKKFTIEYELGQSIKAIILVKVLPGYEVPRVAEAISTKKMADKVFEVTGDYDIVVIASPPDISSVNELIDNMRNTPGVSTTNTLIVLKSW